MAGGTIRTSRIAASTATSGEIAGIFGQRREKRTGRGAAVGANRHVTAPSVDSSGRLASPEHLVEYLLRALGVLIELIRADEQLRHAGALRE